MSWLDPPHRQDAARLLTEGARMAQKAVGLYYLSSDDGRLTDLQGQQRTREDRWSSVNNQNLHMC